MDKNQLQVLARTLVNKYALTQLSNGYLPERIHVYDDAQGNMLYFRIRLKHPKTGDKWIRPFHLDTIKQEYIMNEPRFEDGKPLYHLSTIAKSSTEDIWLFEGEKCVDIAEKLNLLAFIAASRAAFIVVKDKEDAEKRLFIQIKNNLGNCKEGLVFHIEPASLENNINTSRVKWLDETTTISADEALNTFPTVDDDKNSLAEAKDFLFDLLSQNSLTQQQIKKEAKDFGCAWRTVERAKKSLGIKSRKNGDKWEWYFPTQDCQESQTSFTEY